MKGPRYGVFLSLLVFAVLMTGCGSKGIIEIHQGWKYVISDNPDFSSVDFDDSAWESCELPALLSKERKRQVVWMRRNVVIPDSLKGNELSLYGGKIWDADTMYLNGEVIGISGKEHPDFYSAWNRDRVYHLPKNLIRYGEKNILAVRIYSNQKTLINGEPFIGEVRQVEIHAFWKRFFAQYIPLATGLFTLLLGISSLIQFFMDRSDRVSLNYAITSFVWTIISTHYYLLDFGISYNLKENLNYFLLAVIVAWIYFFLESLFKLSYRKLRITMYLLIAFSALLCFTATEADPITGWRSDILGLFSIFPQICWGFLVAKSIKQREARTILFAYIFFMSCLVRDILALTNVITYNFYSMPIGYTSLIVAFGVIISFKSIGTARKLQKTTTEIEDRNLKLRGILKDIRSAVVALTGSTAELSSTSEDLTKRMDTQGASLEETSAAIEEVTASFQSVVDNAQLQDGNIKQNLSLIQQYIVSIGKITSSARSAAELSAKSRQETLESRQSLDKIVEGMNKIKDSSGAIREITVMINEISEQTNLLSLNASIEAARAGEHGRGFAVVAEEIGKLADRAIQQAKSIQEITGETVRDIEEETTIIMASSRSIDTVESSVNDVGSAVESILSLCIEQDNLSRTIQEKMSSISDQSLEITRSTTEQSSTITEVSKALDSLTAIMYGVIMSAENVFEVFEKIQGHIDTLENIAEKSEMEAHL